MTKQETLYEHWQRCELELAESMGKLREQESMLAAVRHEVQRKRTAADESKAELTAEIEGARG